MPKRPLRRSDRVGDCGRTDGHEASRGMTARTERVNGKTLMVFSGRSFPALANEIANELKIATTPTEIYEFANGEIFVRYKESVRGSDAFLVQSMTTPINTWIVETLIMIDALKRGSARRITVVLPYLLALAAAFLAGGTVDIIARQIGQQLSVLLGQPAVIEDRPSGTTIATSSPAATLAAARQHGIADDQSSSRKSSFPC